MSQATRLARALTLGYGYQLTTMLVAVILTPILLRCLGGDDYGKWLLFGQILNLLALLDLGVVGLLARDVALAAGGAEPEADIPKVMRRATWLVWIQTPVVLFVVILVWFFVATVNQSLSGPLALILAGFAAMFPLRIFGTVTLGLQDLIFGQWVQAAVWATTTIISVCLAFSGFGLYSLVISWIAGQCFTVLVQYWRVRIRFPVVRRWSGYPGRAELWLQLRPSLWGSIYQLAGALSVGTDLLVLGWVLGPEAVVVYSCTVKLPTIALHLLNAIMTTSIPAMAGLRAGGNHERFWRAARAVSMTLLLASGLAAVAFTSLNGAFVPLWVGTDRFGGSLLSLFGVMLMLTRHYSITLTGPGYTLGQERRLAFILLAEGVVTVAATFVWTYALGLVGVPLGAMTAMCLITIPLTTILIANKAGVSSFQVILWSTPWLLRLTLVLGPVATVTFLSPVTSIWWASVLALIGITAYSVFSLKLLNQPPLSFFDPLAKLKRQFRLANSA